MNSTLKYMILFGSILMLGGCFPKDNSGSSQETRATMQLQEQASVTVGMPAIINFTEKRQLKMIYELRDTAQLVTYTYTQDMNGKRHKVCPSTSVGFGIPYATQYTAPKGLRMGRAQYPSGTFGIDSQESAWTRYEAEQAEPNGLYMPQSADATWVLCLDPKDQTVKPAYIEQRVMVYMFEMPSAD